MKKIILFLAIATSSYCSYAQVFDTGTKVGIGTPSPHSLLHVSSNQPYSDFGIVSITPSSDVNMSLSLGYDASLGTNGSGWIQSIRSGTAYTPLLLNPINANVGIGTKSPQSKLHIYQAASDATGLVIQGNTINTDASQHYIAMTLDGDYGNGGGNYSQIRSYSNLYYSWGSQLAFYTTQAGIANTLSERMRIDWNGNVGIGTKTPDAKLSVLGTIHTNEVKVDLNVPGPDYVFDSGYKLTDLGELKAYLEMHHHLPEIPSAEQMKKDGLNLGEMNTKLLKKVEELTLYVIQLREQNKKQKDEQEARIAALEKSLLKLTESQSK